MDGMHHTEMDGLDATWRLARQGIEIVKVHKASDAQDVVFTPGTDLVDARKSYQRWNPLWDKIKEEFWAELTPPVHRSTDARWVGQQATPGW